jgi:soluble lytic murein transglycosylase-like protein
LEGADRLRNDALQNAKTRGYTPNAAQFPKVSEEFKANEGKPRGLESLLQAPTAQKQMITDQAKESFSGGGLADFGFTENEIMNMIQTESNFNPSAVSDKGARGALQVMPGAAKDVGANYNEVHDPQAGVKMGLEYLRHIGQKYPVLNNKERMLAGYNWGPSAASEYYAAIDSGQTPPRQMPSETVKYIKRILGGGGAAVKRVEDKRYYSPSRNQTKIIYKDGSSEVINGR